MRHVRVEARSEQVELAARPEAPIVVGGGRDIRGGGGDGEQRDEQGADGTANSY